MQTRATQREIKTEVDGLSAGIHGESNVAADSDVGGAGMVDGAVAGLAFVAPHVVGEARSIGVSTDVDGKFTSVAHGVADEIDMLVRVAVDVAHFIGANVGVFRVVRDAGPR